MEKTFGRNHETGIHFTKCSTQMKHKGKFASNQRSLEETPRRRYQQSTLIQQKNFISFDFQHILEMRGTKFTFEFLRNIPSIINHQIWNKYFQEDSINRK